MGKDANKRLSVFKRLGMSSCLFCCMPFFVTAVYACVLSKASMPYFSSTVSIVQAAKVLGTYIMIFRAYPDTITRRLIYSDIFILTYLY